MARTTSQPTRSKKRTSKGALLLLLGVWGCTPDPDLVYVDLDAAELRVSPPVDEGQRFVSPPYSVEESVPGLEETEVYFGSAEERAIEALNVYREAQERAAQAVLERLKKAFLNEVEQGVDKERDQVQEQYVRWLDEATDELFQLFLQHAERVEPLRHQLAEIVGFPDPDPRSLKVPLESNEKAYKAFLRARSLREQIIALDIEYKAAVDRTFSEIEVHRDTLLASIERSAEGLRADALQRAQTEADKVTKEAQTTLENTALDDGARLPAVPGARGSVNSGPVSFAGTPAVPGLRETREDLEAQLEVFLKTYRYRRTRDATLGRNATQEFLEWRRKYMAGP